MGPTRGSWVQLSFLTTALAELLCACATDTRVQQADSPHKRQPTSTQEGGPPQMGQAQCHRVGTEIRTGPEMPALGSLRQEDAQEVFTTWQDLSQINNNKTSTMGQGCGRRQNMW